MKFRELRRMLKELGYSADRQVGSHEQWTHPTRPGRVTVAGPDGRDVPPGTLKNIMRQIEGQAR